MPICSYIVSNGTIPNTAALMQILWLEGCEKMELSGTASSMALFRFGLAFRIIPPPPPHEPPPERAAQNDAQEAA